MLAVSRSPRGGAAAHRGAGRVRPAGGAGGRVVRSRRVRPPLFPSCPASQPRPGLPSPALSHQRAPQSAPDGAARRRRQGAPGRSTSPLADPPRGGKDRGGRPPRRLEANDRGGSACPAALRPSSGPPGGDRSRRVGRVRRQTGCPRGGGRHPPRVCILPTLSQRCPGQGRGPGPGVGRSRIR